MVAFKRLTTVIAITVVYTRRNLVSWSNNHDLSNVGSSSERDPHHFCFLRASEALEESSKDRIAYCFRKTEAGINKEREEVADRPDLTGAR